MALTFDSLMLWVCALSAATMGFAIQHGATCTVAAMDDLLSKRSSQRLRSILEASLWVLGCLMIARSLGLTLPMPNGYAWGLPSIGGGLLLGLGAYVNQACVFGAVARLGSGQWAYALTPLGFFAGCWLYQPLVGGPLTVRLTEPAWVFQLAPGAGYLAAVLLLVRVLLPLRKHQGGMAALWTPHAATVVIGITFGAMFALAGPWAYTDVLADWAAQHMENSGPRLLLLMALYVGALYGGWRAGRWVHTPVAALDALRCVAGGALMGLGSMMIPGGNDGLILIGMPLLWPFAWVAIASMCAVIALSIRLTSRAL
jgi:uncharacterized membrane protein YedE/YeeE